MKPDFSGEWILNRQASTLESAASAMESGVAWIDHREPRFRFRTTMSAGGKSVEYAYDSCQMEKKSSEKEV